MAEHSKIGDQVVATRSEGSLVEGRVYIVSGNSPIGGNYYDVVHSGVKILDVAANRLRYPGEEAPESDQGELRPDLSEAGPQETSEVTPGDKFDAGKREFDLLPLDALDAVVRVLTEGAKKYSPHGWREVRDLRRRYTNAAARHFFDYLKGIEYDHEDELGEEGTHCHNLACAIVSLMFVLQKDLEAE